MPFYSVSVGFTFLLWADDLKEANEAANKLDYELNHKLYNIDIDHGTVLSWSSGATVEETDATESHIEDYESYFGEPYEGP